MIVFIFFAVYLTAWYIALNELKRVMPKEFEHLGGDKVYFWPPSQSTAGAYFMIVGYKYHWDKIEKYKWSFVLTTLLGWLGLLWMCIYFYDLLKYNT